MATTAGTRIEQEKAWTPTLLRAFELGVGQWQLGLTTGVAPRPRDRSVTAGDVHAVLEEMARAKGRFGLPEEAGGVSGDEAGRDGFWRHRCLVAHGLKHGVVDASSLEVNRRQGLLASPGLRVALQGDGPAQLGQRRPWDGSPLPPALRARLAREWQKVAFRTEQIEALEAARRQRRRTSVEPVVEQVRPLPTRRGMGTNRAWLSGMACFAWRECRHRQPVGALAGLTPKPHQSGQSCHELGIATAGHRHIRAIAIEMAWGWWRFQPESALSRWDQERFGQGSARVRKRGLVALARTRLIALWRFRETGALPQGAWRKTEVR